MTDLPECPGGHVCGSKDCGYEPDECDHCYTAGHACWYECDHPVCGLCRRDDIHDGHAALCTEAGCPCA